MDEEGRRFRVSEALREEMRSLAEETWVREQAAEWALEDGNPYNIVLSAILPEDVSEDDVISETAAAIHGVDPGLHERVMDMVGENVDAQEVIEQYLEKAKAGRDFQWRTANDQPDETQNE